jgi:hypothetical protein
METFRLMAAIENPIFRMLFFPQRFCASGHRRRRFFFPLRLWARAPIRKEHENNDACF